MFERHQTKIAVFGGKPGENMEFKGEFFIQLDFRHSTHAYNATQ
jgi:hypothetical protein